MCLILTTILRVVLAVSMGQFLRISQYVKTKQKASEINGGGSQTYWVLGARNILRVILTIVGNDLLESVTNY